MTNIGYSTIANDNRGPTGNPGAEGPIGNTGGTGADSPITSCRGIHGKYIKSVVNQTTDETVYGHYLITYGVSLGDDITESIDGNAFRGATLFGATGATSGISHGIRNLFINTTISGSTAQFNFKDILSTTSGISVTSDANYITINATGGISPATKTSDNYLTYFSTNTNIITVDADYATLQVTSDNYSKDYLYFNQVSGTTSTSSTLIANTKWIEVPSTVKNTTSQTYLDLSKGGMFYINTPNGIHGFTGFSGVSGATGEITSATLIFENDNIWHFPTNVWFRPEDAHLTCGENIIGIQSTDMGASWNANIFGRGFGVNIENCVPYNMIGSCTTNGTCTNYITKQACDLLLGNFCALKMCEATSTGSCCLNGTCKEQVSDLLCAKYGGRFWGPDVSCTNTFCFDPCASPIPTSSCCVTNTDLTKTCLDRYSTKECEELEGVFSLDSCAVREDCVDVTDDIGACCIVDGCVLKTYNECQKLSGVYMGIGEVCKDVNCDCVNPTDPQPSTELLPPQLDIAVITKEVRVYSTNDDYICVTVTDTPVNLSKYRNCE